MDAATYKAHRVSVMRSPGKMRECLAAHGQEMPAKRQDQIKLHDEVCKPEAAQEPEATAQPTPEPEPAKPEPKDEDKPAAQAPPRRRTRKPAAKADEPAQPESKPQPKLEDISVPYAKLTKQGRNTVATCPECGRTFVEKFDRTGEQTTQNYGAHYVQEHKAQPKPEPAKRTRKAAPKPEPKAEEPCTYKRSGKHCIGIKGHEGSHVMRGATEVPEAAKPEPAKRGRKPQPQPQPVPEANGTSPRVHKQELARELVNLVAEHFAGRTAEDRERISYWLRGLPVGNPELPGTVGGYLRWWPESKLPRPAGKDWYPQPGIDMPGTPVK